jgi:hypothetical protein
MKARFWQDSILTTENTHGIGKVSTHRPVFLCAPCGGLYATFSIASAIPMPPLTHKVATPRFALRFSIS